MMNYIPNDSLLMETCHFFVDFPGALAKLLRNPVYLLLNLATVFEMIIVTGFLTYVPKYLQTQFDVKSSEANLYTGMSSGFIAPSMIR